jgi:hypothetical protein
LDVLGFEKKEEQILRLVVPRVSTLPFQPGLIIEGGLMNHDHI